MSGFGRFVVVLDWIIVVAVSVFVIAWSMAFIPGDFNLDQVGSEAQVTFVLCGGFLLAINLLFVVRAIRKSRYQRSLRFQNPAGEVAVHLGAVEECLTKCARDSDDVRDVKVRVFVRTKDKPVKVAVTVWLWDAPDIPSIVEKLQERLRGRFLEILNADDPVDVDVTVRKFVAKQAVAHKPVAEKSKSSDDDGFKGPEYPID